MRYGTKITHNLRPEVRDYKSESQKSSEDSIETEVKMKVRENFESALEIVGIG